MARQNGEPIESPPFRRGYRGHLPPALACYSDFPSELRSERIDVLHHVGAANGRELVEPFAGNGDRLHFGFLSERVGALWAIVETEIHAPANAFSKFAF